MTRPSDAAPEQGGEAQEALSEEERETLMEGGCTCGLPKSCVCVDDGIWDFDGMYRAVESILATRRAEWEAERGAIQAEALEAVADDVRTSPSTRLGDMHPGEVWEAWLRDRARTLRAASTEGGE